MDDNLFEIIELYSELIEKQDEIIARMGRIIARQAEDIGLVRNDREFSDPKLEHDMDILNEVMHEYDSYMNI